jgi:hypothetical protein
LDTGRENAELYHNGLQIIGSDKNLIFKFLPHRDFASTQSNFITNQDWQSLRKPLLTMRLKLLETKVDAKNCSVLTDFYYTKTGG